MNQEQYVDISDRVRVANALQILSDIIPEQSTVITPSELHYVLTALRHWEERLLARIKIS